VGKFDLFLAAPSILTSIAARHLTCFNTIAIDFQMYVLSASFVIPMSNVIMLIFDIS